MNHNVISLPPFFLLWKQGIIYPGVKLLWNWRKRAGVTRKSCSEMKTANTLRWWYHTDAVS